MEIIYKTNLPLKDDIYRLYELLEWNAYLKLDSEKLIKAMENSYCSVYAYCDNELIGTGRVISDGVINAYLCGLGVLPGYRNHGIATKIVEMLMKLCIENKLHLQLFCEDHLVKFYEEKGFEEFAIGMKVSDDKLLLK